MMYDPANWYWIVGGDQTKVWSSARAGFFSSQDSAYLSWVAQGGGATQIGSLEELAQVLASQYPAGMLITYANAVQWAKATGGYEVEISGQPVVFPTTSESMGLISGKAQRLEQPNPPTEIIWQTGVDTFITIPAADFTGIAVEIADFVQGTFDKLKDVMSEIGDGTITSREQVVAAFNS